jgi:hypothetical protein
MAQVSYNQGVTSVSPDARPPDDFQHIQANPSSFGALVGAGMEQAGQGALQAGQFYNRVASDNAANDFQDYATKLLRGDPTKTTIGPDGNPQQDLGYMGLRGRAALDARPEVERQLDERIKEIRSGLTSPQQQLEFDTITRRYRSRAAEEIGTHADGQAQVWSTGVNQASEKLALTHIAINADNPEEVAHGASDLINARVKNVQLSGGTDEQIKEAVESGKRDALTAQLQAIAVTDPSRAMRMLDKNRAIAGIQYDNLAKDFRARADKQDGDRIGTEALKKTYGPVPDTAHVLLVLDNIGQRYGVSGSYLQRTWQIEASGSFNPPDSSTGASGPFQFTKVTARDVGLNNPHDFTQSADAAAKLAADNKILLHQSLGRSPTDAELYIAHQQGAQGAALLLENPNVRAGDLVGDKAIRVNGGDPNAPARDFTAMWTAKFNGAGASMSSARKAAAYQIVASDPSISEAVRDHAIAHINRDITMQMQAQEQTAQARKLASDAAANDVVTKLQTGQSVSVYDIANNPNLNWETKLRLQEIIEHKSGSDLDSATNAYGPGFWDAYKAVSANADDPSRISDYNTLLSLAGPNSDPNKRITLAGVAKLNEIMNGTRKSVADQAVNTTKLGLMNYAKGKLSFEQDTGPIKIRDPKGEAIFNGTFIPKFEAAYDAWVKAGKNPWEFLSKENIDKMITGMRSQSEMQMSRMAAMGEAGAGDKNAQLPAAPQGIDPAAWQKLMQNRPSTENGTQFAPAAWATALNMLLAKPTPETIRQFNASKFGRAGFDGAKLIEQLRGKPSAPSAPAAQANTPELALP